MNWDVVIAGGIAVTQLFITIYAVWVSVAENRIKIAFVLALTGILGITLTVWGAIRSGGAQEKLLQDIVELKNGQQTANKGIADIRNTPPTVNVIAPKPVASVPAAANVAEYKMESAYRETANNVPTGRQPWLVPNKSIEANLQFTNSGSATADMSKGGGVVYLMPSDASKPIRSKQPELDKDVQLLIPKFKTFLAGIPRGQNPLSTDGRSTWWFTARSERPITEDDISKLATGGEILFLFYDVEYSDPRGYHYIHRCLVAQAPAFAPEVWGGCNGYEDHK